MSVLVVEDLGCAWCDVELDVATREGSGTPWDGRSGVAVNSATSRVACEDESMCVLSIAIWSLLEGELVRVTTFHMDCHTLLAVDGEGLVSLDATFIGMTALRFEADLIVASFSFLLFAPASVLGLLALAAVLGALLRRLLLSTTTFGLGLLALHTVEITSGLTFVARVNLLVDVALAAAAPLGVWSTGGLMSSAWIAFSLDFALSAGWFLALTLLPFP